MIASLFYNYGSFCASHPWEVIVTALTLMTCMLTLEPLSLSLKTQQGYSGADTVVIALTCSFALFHIYYQVGALRKPESKPFSLTVSLFTIFSFSFTWIAVGFFSVDALDLKDVSFLFLFLLDVSRAAKLAHFALNGFGDDFVCNIATGVSLVGPCMMLDAIIKLLIIGVGNLSGLPALEPLLQSACLAIILNYFLFVTFYPAYLSLVLGLSYATKPPATLVVEFQKLNPVVQRVKVIMCGGLLFVNFNSRLTCALAQRCLIWGADYIHYLFLLTVLILMGALLPNNRKLKVCENRNEEKGIQTEIAYDSSNLTDEEIVFLVKNKRLPVYQIEKLVGDLERCVKIRRRLISASSAIQEVPYRNFNYGNVLGACCENVIGYIPVPVGIVGPLLLDGSLTYIPMATTEGCLVASTNRGCRALLKTGVTSRVVSDGMTRGPVVRFPSMVEASDVKSWLEKIENFRKVKASFDSSSRFARLTRINARIAGRYLFIRFVAKTGDAMGMNMLSKGTESSLNFLQGVFSNMEILSLSGNFCTDKKPSAVNWVEGRGKSVVCEAVIPAQTVSTILKTSVHSLVDVNISKNLIGSAIAGSIGGFNAHASNIVTAVFIATGQDPAQNVTSSNCITLMEPWGSDGNDLYISCTMPSIEVGTVGGGTVLPAQAACLDLLGVRGSNSANPGENANKLATIVCATVLAGEVSLMAALTTGHVVKSHLKYNRSTVPS